MSSMDYSDTCERCGDEMFEVYFGNSVRKKAVRCFTCKEVEPVGMTLDEYQVHAARTMKRGRPSHHDLCDYVMGLCGEAGELANAVKKMLFHGHEWDEKKILEETGDVLWYTAAIVETLEASLGEVARQNIEKLYRRYPNGFSEERSREREPHEA